MLRSTFCHIPGIGPKTERQLWAAGLRSWPKACDAPSLPLAPTAAGLLR